MKRIFKNFMDSKPCLFIGFIIIAILALLIG